MLFGMVIPGAPNVSPGLTVTIAFAVECAPVVSVTVTCIVVDPITVPVNIIEFPVPETGFPFSVHTYVYGPVPPTTFAVTVSDCPTSTTLFAMVTPGTLLGGDPSV